ncbi:MAG TPA: DinB family protein [Flavisolibacter sp.]|nr:DinB family protein [Flavisolibacter sp.]
MQQEITRIIDQLKDSYEGEPWFGRNLKTLLGEVDADLASQKINGQHSILELLYHMIVWREFTISRLQPTGKELAYFEEYDWQQLDHANKQLWSEGLQKLEATQQELLRLLPLQNDALLEEKAEGREYNFRKLLYGIIQHDIYHLGQIAFLTKALRSR